MCIMVIWFAAGSIKATENLQFNIIYGGLKIVFGGLINL
jgi:hypothetical protein